MAIGPGELEISAASNGWFINKPRAGDAVFGEGIKEVAAGAIATLPNFKTNQGQAATIANQAAAATDASIEGSADVTKVAVGPTTNTLNYDSAGTLTSTMPKNIPGYFLTPAGGAAYTSGVSWAASVVAGSFVGTGPTVSTTSGQGTLILNSGITGGDVTVAMTPTINGKSYPPILTKISRNTADVNTGGTSSGGGTAATRAIYLQLNSTSFVTITEEMTITIGSSGSATLSVSADLWNNNIGSKTVEIKAQRETSPGTWADVGTVIQGVAPGANSGDMGFISGSRSATGLTVSSSQKFRFVGRLTALGSVDVGGNGAVQG